MNNKDKALELINEDKWEAFEECVIVNEHNLVKKAIELAAKPDWYYPSKGEFPDTNKSVITIKEFPGITEESLTTFKDCEKDYWLEYVKAWTYLPKFEE